MQYERYKVEVNEDKRRLELTSDSPNGKCIKVLQYNETNLKGFYNLGFDDKDLKTGRINDLVITNNSDSKRILSTVAARSSEFTKKHKNAYIFATGNTKA